MKVIFLGGFFPKEFSKSIFENSLKQVQNAANNFQWAFIKGLKENLETKLFLITAPFIGWYPLYYKKVCLKQKSFLYADNTSLTMVGFLNLPIIKNAFKIINLKKQLRKMINSSEKTIIIVYSLDTPYLTAAVRLKEEYPKLKICVIVPDLHEFPGDSSLLYKWYIKFYEKPIFYKLLCKIDCFVLLSDKMVDYLKINKPWVRVEGLYEIKETKSVNYHPKKFDKKIILYTGTLDFKYGIRELLSAFKLIDDESFELWICGGGRGANAVEKTILVDRRVKYFGIVPSDNISELQARATLLVNPRNTIGEYNKYSFPSKTMEYLASGTPALLYKLAGIPDEYYNYCYTLKDNEVQTLANAMEQICNLNNNILAAKGIEAKDFILTQKTTLKQCRKVVDMLENLD